VLVVCLCLRLCLSLQRCGCRVWVHGIGEASDRLGDGAVSCDGAGDCSIKGD
jgi:hypothetical protein